MQPPSAKSIQCVVVTPERAVLDEPADFVALPMYDGELGVAPGRLAMIGRLGIGELRVKRGPHTKRFFVDGGFAQVRGDVVSVLTQNAIAAEDIKPDAVVTEVQTAQAQVARTAEAVEEKAKAQQRAQAKRRIVAHTLH